MLESVWTTTAPFAGRLCWKMSGSWAVCVERVLCVLTKPLIPGWARADRTCRPAACFTHALGCDWPRWACDAALAHRGREARETARQASCHPCLPADAHAWGRPGPLRVDADHTRHCAEGFTEASALSPLGGRHNHCPDFTDEEGGTERQKGLVPW